MANSPSGQSTGIVSPLQAVANAVAEAQRLTTVDRWKAGFEGASPDAPWLVSRLDLGGEYSYLVSFRVGLTVTARVRVRADNGKVGETIGIDDRTSELPPYLTVSEVLTKLLTTRRLPRGAQRLPTVDPFLVWQPSVQSLSIFEPFYQLRYDASTFQYAHVISGTIYDRLTSGAGI